MKTKDNLNPARALGPTEAELWLDKAYHVFKGSSDVTVERVVLYRENNALLRNGCTRRTYTRKRHTVE